MINAIGGRVNDAKVNAISESCKGFEPYVIDEATQWFVYNAEFAPKPSEFRNKLIEISRSNYESGSREEKEFKQSEDDRAFVMASLEMFREKQYKPLRLLQLLDAHWPNGVEYRDHAQRREVMNGSLPANEEEKEYINSKIDKYLGVF